MERWELCINAGRSEVNRFPSEKCEQVTRLVDKQNLNAVQLWKNLARQLNLFRTKPGFRHYIYIQEVKYSALECVGPDMISIFRWVKKQRHDRVNSWFCFHAQKYARTCCYIINEWNKREKQTKKVRESGLLDIAKKVNELKSLFIDSSSPFFDSSLSHEEKKVYGLLEQGHTSAYRELGGDKILLNAIINEEYMMFNQVAERCRYVCDSKSIRTTHLKKKYLSHFNKTLPVNESSLLCDPMNTPALQSRMDDSSIYSDWILGRLGESTLIDILNFIEKQATELATKPSDIPQPNNPNAAVHFFVRKLYDYHMKVFKKPLWDTLALAGTICFKLVNPLDESAIRPWFKLRKPA